MGTAKFSLLNWDHHYTCLHQSQFFHYAVISATFLWAYNTTSTSTCILSEEWISLIFILCLLQKGCHPTPLPIPSPFFNSSSSAWIFRSEPNFGCLVPFSLSVRQQPFRGIYQNPWQRLLWQKGKKVIQKSNETISINVCQTKKTEWGYWVIFFH